MDKIVNIISSLNKGLEGSGVALSCDGGLFRVRGSAGIVSLRPVRLYRPSVEDVTREAAPDVLLVLTAASPRAVRSARRHNYVSVPSGGYRIVAPGVVLINEALPEPEVGSRQVRLTGRTGVVVETLLLGGPKRWSVQDLAEVSATSPSLAHRVVTRLEREGLLTAQGHGPEKVRSLSHARALAELWSQEEKRPQPLARGFLYGATTEAVAQKVLAVCPGAALGSVLAANLYSPVLTRVSLPIRVWVPEDFTLDQVEASGFERVESGANVEFVQAKGDPWLVHRNTERLPCVSPWRAWVEIAEMRGRTEDLADTLRSDLERRVAGKETSWR